MFGAFPPEKLETVPSKFENLPLLSLFRTRECSLPSKSRQINENLFIHMKTEREKQNVEKELPPFGLSVGLRSAFAL